MTRWSRTSTTSDVLTEPRPGASGGGREGDPNRAGPRHPASAGPEAVGPAAQRGRPLAVRLAAFGCGLGLFVAALGIMKAGAQALIPALQGSIFTDHAWSTLGLGWLGACLVLSGSPIATSSLTLLEGGAIDRTQAFTMLTGSRLGASFVVLVVGAIYAFRRTSGRRAPMSIGILSLSMTLFAYLPGAFLGWLLLSSGKLDGLNVVAPPGLLSVTDTLFGWAVGLAKSHVPGWALFPFGLAVLLGAFKILDHALPSVGSGRLEQRRLEGGSDAWYCRHWPMFFLGCGVALVTLSVSVALTVLVPLVAKGYLRKDQTLPYIAGANITTLADTLVAAVLLDNPDASRVVLAEMLGVTAWTLVLLGILYPSVRGAVLRIARSVLASRARLAGSLVVLLSVPLTLVML